MIQTIIKVVKTLKDLVLRTLLYDFYGELLNEHQKHIYEDYVLNDLSLAEIAQENGISRQGVHDLIKRCDKTFEAYESKLHLVEKFENTKELVREIKNLVEDYKVNANQESLVKVENIAQKILNEM